MDFVSAHIKGFSVSSIQDVLCIGSVIWSRHMPYAYFVYGISGSKCMAMYSWVVGEEVDNVRGWIFYEEGFYQWMGLP